MFARIIGVFKLSAATFEEIEHNTSLTLPAAIIVMVVSLVSGIGNGFFNGFFHRSFLSGFIGSLLGVLLGWLLWSADLGQMLRVIGFAYTPMVLSIIPCVGGLIGIIWAIAAGFIAIRQGLDLDDMKAFFTVLVGALAYIVLTGILNLIF
jgi:hypothetical protein